MPSFDFIRNANAVSTIVHKEVYDIIKEELKNKLKVKTTITLPHSLVDGELITEVIYDGEVISKEVQQIKLSSTIFSF